MDLLLIGTDEGTLLRPSSVHGILWLQTHFENEHWEALSSNNVRLATEDAQALANDAKAAGLRLNSLPLLSIAHKF